MRKTLFLFLVITTMLSARERMPLPAQVMSAHTVFLDNRASAKIGDAVYTELRKWGRFALVDSAGKADLILLVTTQQYIDEDSASVAGKIIDSTSTENSLHISFLDPKNNNPIWSDTRPYATTIGAARLIKSLRARMREQEKDR